MMTLAVAGDKSKVGILVLFVAGNPNSYVLSALDQYVSPTTRILGLQHHYHDQTSHLLGQLGMRSFHLTSRGDTFFRLNRTAKNDRTQLLTFLKVAG